MFVIHSLFPEIPTNYSLHERKLNYWVDEYNVLGLAGRV